MTMNDNSKDEIKVKIAFVLWTLEGMGGSETVVFDIARKLNKNLFDVLIISFKEGPVRKIYENIGVKVAVIEKKSKVDVQFVYYLRRLLQENNIQLVNAHHFYPLLYTFLAKTMTDIMIVYTEHSVWQYQEMNRVRKILLKFILRNTSVVIAISKQLFYFYKISGIVSVDKIKLIINGIDLSRFQINYNSIKSKLNIPPNDKMIGMIANIRPEKNHKLLISAFSRLVNIDHFNLRLILVGLDRMNGDVQRYANDTRCSDRIHFLGSRTDVADILNSLDVFCLPSSYEGLPLTILEAMACGVPVIGANVMGINEVITHNVNGLLFDSGDGQMLYESLKKIIEDDCLRLRLKEAGVEFVKENYNLDDKIKEYEELFQYMYAKRKFNIKE